MGFSDLDSLAANGTTDVCLVHFDFKAHPEPPIDLLITHDLSFVRFVETV